MLICYIDTPMTFYGQAASQLECVQQMTASLEAVQSSANAISGLPQTNKVMRLTAHFVC